MCPIIYSANRTTTIQRTQPVIRRQFGTGVVSYFVFLRWLILHDFLVFLMCFLLIILPYSVSTLLPHQTNKSAPNTTVFTDEYLEQFTKPGDIPFSRQRVELKNVSLTSVSDDLLGNLGTLFDNYTPDEILGVADYDKKNYTGEHRYRISRMCKEKYDMELKNRTKEVFTFLQDFLQGTGWLQSTILFLGHYPDRDVSYFGLTYNLAICFLAVLFVSYFLSLIFMVRYSSQGIQENLLNREGNFLTFTNIVFCSWDYCIEDKKMADIRQKSITCEIKSNLMEEHRKNEVSQWSSGKRAKVNMLRIIVIMIIFAVLYGSFYLIIYVVKFQLEEQRQNVLKDGGVYALLIEFLPPIVITVLNLTVPIIFSKLVKFEQYCSQTEVSVTLIRIVFLRLASLFVLISSLYKQITCEPKDQCGAGLSNDCRSPICWETYVGQSIYKLAITDFAVYLFNYFAYDLLRDFIVQRFKCKVTEAVGRQVFDLPSQVLNLVYSQILCWLGLLYSPLIAGISCLKFLILFYLKKNLVLNHCVPSPVLYKTSRTNAIFMILVLFSLLAATGIYGFSITSIEPSPGCSPFRSYVVMIEAISHAIQDWSPKLLKFLSFIFSAFFLMPASLILCLPIYYYWSLMVAQRKMTKILKAQIAVEGRDKQFLLNRLAEAAKQITSN